LICTSCEKQKLEVHLRKSRLIPGHVMYLCNDCIAAKMEPRYVVILAGRSFGPDAVKEYIRKRRYFGEDILATELL